MKVLVKRGECFFRKQIAKLEEEGRKVGAAG
jgi:hypothetical protein